MTQDTFVQLVDAHYASLYRFALSLARSGADASDLVQQTFFIWATKGDSLKDAGAAKAWLFTTLYREFLRARRRGARTESLDAQAPGGVDVAADDVDRAVKCDAEAAMQALQGVEESFRAPLTLFYLEDFSYQEIAAALEIPMGTVMSRLSRGKAELRARLESAGTRGQVISFRAAQGGSKP